MTVSTLADDVAIALGIAFVTWMIWLLVFPGRRDDGDTGARHEQSAVTDPAPSSVTYVYPSAPNGTAGRMNQQRRMTQPGTLSPRKIKD